MSKKCNKEDYIQVVVDQNNTLHCFWGGEILSYAILSFTSSITTSYQDCNYERGRRPSEFIVN